LILDGHSKEYYPLSYLDVNTRRKLSALPCDKKLVGVKKIPVNTASAKIQGF
jgi:hypothetical protein